MKAADCWSSEVKKVYSVSMSIELTQEQEQLIQRLIETGRYENDRAVLSQSLKLIRGYTKASLLTFVPEIRKGEESGDYRPFDVEDTIRRAREQREQHMSAVIVTKVMPTDVMRSGSRC